MNAIIDPLKAFKKEWQEVVIYSYLFNYIIIMLQHKQLQL